MMPDDDDGDENDELWIQSDLAFIFFFLIQVDMDFYSFVVFTNDLYF